MRSTSSPDWHDNASARTMQQRRVGNMPSVRPGVDPKLWKGVFWAVVATVLCGAALYGLLMVGK